MPGQRQKVLRDADTKWGRVPYQVTLGEQFSSPRMIYENALNSWGERSGGNESGKTAINGGLGQFSGIHTALLTHSYQDTRVGANDAVNCLWQFNRDDDIVHPSLITGAHTVYANSSDNTESSYGEGRVYASTTQMNQSVAYLSFGIPQYSDVGKFLANAINEDMSQYNAIGSSKGFKLGQLFGALGILAFPIVFVPLKLFQIASKLATTTHVNRFYDFKRQMHAYYTYVDSICAQWLVATGLYGEAESKTQGSGWFSNLMGAMIPGFTMSNDALPLALRINGPSIFDMLTLKARNLGYKEGWFSDGAKNVQEQLDRINENVSSSVGSENETYSTAYPSWSGENLVVKEDTSFSAVLKNTAAGATQFVGFRIEKGVSASESFDNQAGPSTLAEKINSKIQETKDSALTKAAGIDQSQQGTISNIANFLSGITSTIASFVGLGEAMSAVTCGAYVDIPDEYKSSSFNKSHSLSFQLRAPYGDVVTIYQTIIVPMALILAGALPRAAGPNSYQQPFICQAYCKGIFSVPMGLIESVSLERGSSEFGWTYKNLPTTVNINISIKDLSPIMYMTMRGSSISDLISSDNSSFDEYLNTLAGVGLFERLSGLNQLRRSTELAMHTLRNKYFNPNYWASDLGGSGIAQAIGQIFMDNKIPRN